MSKPESTRTKTRVESLLEVIFSDAGDDELIRKVQEYDPNISKENIESYKATFAGEIKDNQDLKVILKNNSIVIIPARDWDFR